jgi:hypothetical protein
MIKKAASKAAASEKLKRTFYRYVEALSDARTKLAGFFSILRYGLIPVIIS